MNTEELMKLADAYANAAQGYNMATLNKARAALEAALSAKQEPDWTDSETGLLECWKNRLHPMSDRLLMADGAIAFRDKIIANLRSQLASLSAKQGEQERISELEAQNAQLLESLRHMVTFFERFEDTHTVLAMDEARAAIAAVEGKV